MTLPGPLTSMCRRRSANGTLPVVALCLIVMGSAVLAPGRGGAENDREYLDERPDRPDGVHILDGSYVLNYGEFHVNITNHGLIGSQYTQTLPYSSAPSGQWPGGSGDEYLWGAGLWVGGIVRGEVGVTTGQPERELRPDVGLLDTIYEAKNKRATRPWPADKDAGWRLPDSRADDDGDGLRDEDPLTGHDDDGDGLVDEDFAQLGEQMFTCNMFDNLPLVQEIYPNHLPLGLKVTQRAAAWERADLEDVVILEYEITNAGIQDIHDVYLGFYVDGDIQRRGDRSSQPDDLAGFFGGPLRGSDGAYHRMQVAWMTDGNPVDPLPGWLGCVLLDHDTDYAQLKAPNKVEVRSFQIFATNAAVSQEGEPKSDADRYTLMKRQQIDPDRHPSQAADLKFMISSGPFGTVEQGRTLTYRLALVMADSKEKMLAKALQVYQLQRGREYDLDFNWLTGQGGRETLVCVGDLPPYSDGSDPIFRYRSAFMDESCVGPDPVFGYELINIEQMFVGPDGRKCLYANADNCEECYRAMGRECTIENGLYWEFLARYPSRWNPQYYTGLFGREHNEPWVEFGETPPRPPAMRVVPGPKQVEVFWDDASEHDPDYLRGVVDFESYRVWRVAGWTREPGTSPGQDPTADAWSMIQEYDLANFVPPEATRSGRELPLGRNTGLEDARYTPPSLSDPRFAGLAEAMAAVVLADSAGRHVTRPALRAPDGSVVPGMEGLIRWEAHPTALDTFFAVTPRKAGPGVVGKRATRYYHHVDHEAIDGFEAYYSVVAADHSLRYIESLGRYVPNGYGIQSDPANNYLATMAGPLGQTVEEIEKYGRNIYVYPNPATREALAEFQRQPPSGDDPTGERVMFNNLPAASNLISIFTTSGDLVATVEHDGRNAVGSASWNLVSRNGQEVVSGIYIFTVQSEDTRFEDFRGTFVVIR